MSEKAAQKARAHASALVEPGETVRHAVPVTTGPRIAHSLGMIGVALLKFRIVAVTEMLLLKPYKEEAEKLAAAAR